MNTLTWFLLGCGATYLIMTNPEMASSVGDMLVDIGNGLSDKSLKQMAANDNIRWTEPTSPSVWFYLITFTLGSIIGASVITSLYIAYRLITGV